MMSRVILVFCVAFISSTLCLWGGPEDPAHRCAQWGYPFEQHFVQTFDGWTLNLQRIPGPRDSSKNTSNRPVVLLQHGFIDASSGWLLNPVSENLPTILADANVDVWMGNNRGNSYSNTSRFYNSSQINYWDFSIDEMAATDLPALIYYILNVTNQQQLIYIGLSQGTIQAFAGFSSMPSLASRVKLFIALAPIAYMAHVNNSLLRILSALDIANFFGIQKFYLSPVAFEQEFPNFCNGSFHFICKKVQELYYGGDPATNHTAAALEMYASNEPDWTSTKDVIHLTQLIKSGEFCKYDYGKAGNILRYGTKKPPIYPLSQMTVPLALFSGSLDELADPLDIAHLISSLPNGTIVYNKVVQNFTHTDWNWSTTASQLAYPYILQLIAKYFTPIGFS